VRSSSEPLGEKIILDRQLTDFRVQPLDLAFRPRLGVLPDRRVERTGCVLLQLLVPSRKWWKFRVV